MNTKGMDNDALRGSRDRYWPVKAGHYKRRRRREFLDFMNGIIDAYGKEKEIHVILDNLNPTFSTREVHDPGGAPNGHRDQKVCTTGAMFYF